MKFGQVIMSDVNVSLKLSGYQDEAHACVIANPGTGVGEVRPSHH